MSSDHGLTIGPAAPTLRTAMRSRWISNRFASRCRQLACVLVPLVFWTSCAGPGLRRQASPSSAEVTAWLDEGFVGRRMITPHFELLSTLQDREFEAALPQLVESFYGQYARSIRMDDTQRLPKMRMYLFGNRREWRRFVYQRYPVQRAVIENIHAGGFSDRGMSASFYRDRSQFIATLAHEGWHQYAATRFDRRLPDWLNEGLACYFEAANVAGTEVDIHPERNTFRLDALRQAVQRNQLVSLDRLVQMRADDALLAGDRDKIQAYYAQVWALVTWLRHAAGSKRKAAFKRLLHNIGDRRMGAQLSAARLLDAGSAESAQTALIFSIYFSQPPHAMQDDYESYVIRLVGY